MDYMQENIINHLFEFWEYIGWQGNFLNVEKGYTYTNPKMNSWPNRIFALDTTLLNFEEFNLKIKTGKLPNSLAVAENKYTETLLLQHGFKEKSVVKTMFLDRTKYIESKVDFSSIEHVDNDNMAIEFARVASLSFEYQIQPNTIILLFRNKNRISLFLGRHNNEFVSCGILYHDKKGNSGIHMIGTLPKVRGLGLGKTMTTKLISEAYKKSNNKIVLVASESGERIYSKIGFSTHGALKSYVL